MNKRTAVLVTGSRDWLNYDPVRDRLRRYPVGTVLIHGNCGKVEYANGFEGVVEYRGADKIAHDIGQDMGFICWPLPYFSDLGTRGGPKRNECMFDVLLALRLAGHACFVEGFPIGESKGTRGCLRIAERYNDQCERDGRHNERVAIHVTEGSLYVAP